MSIVSICIPTYKLPDLPKAAIDSCLAQTFQDFEIVISDDSADARTEEMIQSLFSDRTIRYVRNDPGLGQAKNVNQLFGLAQGEFLMLLPDDDFLTPAAVETLLKPLEKRNVVAAFGRQYLATHEDAIIAQESEAMNDRYLRSASTANKIQRSECSALFQQFPCEVGCQLQRRSRDPLAR